MKNNIKGYKEFTKDNLKVMKNMVQQIKHLKGGKLN